MAVRAPAPRQEVVDAMTRAAIELGWLPVAAESSDLLVTVMVRPSTWVEPPQRPVDRGTIERPAGSE